MVVIQDTSTLANIFYRSDSGYGKEAKKTVGGNLAERLAVAFAENVWMKVSIEDAIDTVLALAISQASKIPLEDLLSPKSSDIQDPEQVISQLYDQTVRLQSPKQNILPIFQAAIDEVAQFYADMFGSLPYDTGELQKAPATEFYKTVVKQKFSTAQAYETSLFPVIRRGYQAIDAFIEHYAIPNIGKDTANAVLRCAMDRLIELRFEKYSPFQHDLMDFNKRLDAYLRTA